MSVTSPTAGRELLARIASMGTLEVLLISSLHFDKAYQRDLRNDFAQVLATNWTTTALGFPVVSRRADGKLYVINGQHRIAAATIIGLDSIVCLVVSGLSEAEEAELRLAGNVHLVETSLETFRAKLAAKYPDALDLVKITERFDTHINAVATKYHGLNAVATLERIYGQDRGATLVSVFELIRDTWGKVEGEYAGANMLKAMAWVLEAHTHDDHFNRDRFIEKMRETGPAALQLKAHAHRAVMQGSMWLNLYRAMVEVYNGGLAEASRLQWRTRGWSKKGGGGWEA